jgi:hypothetical protein
MVGDQQMSFVRTRKNFTVMISPFIDGSLTQGTKSKRFVEKRQRKSGRGTHLDMAEPQTPDMSALIPSDTYHKHLLTLSGELHNHLRTAAATQRMTHGSQDKILYIFGHCTYSPGAE